MREIKKSITISLLFFIATSIILFLDKNYTINSLFLFILFNLILFFLAIFQIINLKKKYSKIYLVNPPVLCTFFTFLLPFCLTNFFIEQQMLRFLVNHIIVNKFYFIIINSLNLMWTGYWIADYFYNKNFLSIIGRYVLIRRNFINFNSIFIFSLLSIFSFFIMNYFNIYGFTSSVYYQNKYVTFLYPLNLLFSLNYVILIVLSFYFFSRKTNSTFKFFYLFFIFLTIIFGIFSGFKSNIFFPFFIILMVSYILKNKILYILLFLAIFSLYISYYPIEYFRNQFNKYNSIQSDNNFVVVFNTYNSYAKSLVNKKDVNLDSILNSVLFDKTQRIALRLNNLSDSILLMNITHSDPNILSNNQAPSFFRSIILSPIMSIIPRFLWKDKPMNLEGSWATNLLYQDFCRRTQIPDCTWISGSTSMSSFLYLYYAGGTLMVFFFYFLLGFVQNIIFKMFASEKFLSSNFIFVTILPIISIIDSAIYGIISFFFREFIILLILQYFIFKKKE